MKHDSLATVLQHQQQQRDLAQVGWTQATNAEHAAQQRLAQLQAYRDEYQSHWSGQFRRSGGIELLQCYQGFMQRLDEAIAQQQVQAQHAQSQQQHAAAQLQEAAQRVAAVEKLMVRRQQAHQVQQNRQDQRRADDNAQRRRASPHHPNRSHRPENAA